MLDKTKTAREEGPSRFENKRNILSHIGIVDHSSPLLLPKKQNILILPKY